MATRKKLTKKAPVRAPASAGMLQLLVTLDDVKPAVWRRLLVPADFPLSLLHPVFQVALGWTNSHLHAWNIGGRRYAPDDGEVDVETENNEDFRLGDLVHAGSRFLYEYDFGDSWMHRVEVEKVLPVDPRFPWPACLDGKNACPPEDCGGAPGYEELRRALASPRHPEHDEMRTWVGGYFDPAGFDANVVNGALREMWDVLTRPEPRRGARSAR
ncbi:MAG: plasmid pRiA4b ORF-3 family protein [Deltaproteobacteria bacterium]|nr:plasmid pRiA4b ORF-3 family protein [Deltaproteobacteria bacterium]